MEKRSLLFIFLMFYQLTANAADLLEVYVQAQNSDPIFRQAITRRFLTASDVPINIADLLPSISVRGEPGITHSSFSGSFVGTVAGQFISPRNNTQRAYSLSLVISQTVFDFAKFSRVRNALANAKAANATLNAEIQNLMVRVVTAYFNVLRDEDNLKYSQASKRAFAGQLSHVRDQLKVGVSTLADVYEAKAAYETAVANYIDAQTLLENDRERLRVMTGIYYPHLSRLSEKFPLVRPNPASVDAWVKIAQLQNWTIRASQYSVSAARQTVKEEFSHHLPTIKFQANMDRVYNSNINGYLSIYQRSGTGIIMDKQVSLKIDVPIYEGGKIVAGTQKAIYNFDLAQQKLEQDYRETIFTTRQSYLGILSGINKINSDKLAIKSSTRSLREIRDNYDFGREIFPEILNQQKKLYEAQAKYATDKYEFIKNVLLLKQAAGTLSFEDLSAINLWLRN